MSSVGLLVFVALAAGAPTMLITGPTISVFGENSSCQEKESALLKIPVTCPRCPHCTHIQRLSKSVKLAPQWCVRTGRGTSKVRTPSHTSISPKASSFSLSDAEDFFSSESSNSQLLFPCALKLRSCSTLISMRDMKAATSHLRWRRWRWRRHYLFRALPI